MIQMTGFEAIALKTSETGACVSLPRMCSSSTGGKPAACGVSFVMNAITTATTVQSPAGIQKSQRQCNGGVFHKPRKTKTASKASPNVLMRNMPAVITQPKKTAETT